MKRALSLLLLLLSVSILSQNFSIEGNKTHFKVPFKLVNNLILIPVSINGSFPMDFILDTGSAYTIVTNESAIRYFTANKGDSISIRGLGVEQTSLEAYLSQGNSIEVGKAFSSSNSLVLLYNPLFDYSSYFGVPIYGIIGYDLMKDFVVRVNYRNKSLHFYEPNYFHENKKVNKYDVLPLSFDRDKPYLRLQSVIEGNPVSLNLLIDSGSTEALWLFEKENISVPERYINDNLGYGLNGEIIGKRGRIASVNVGRNLLEQPIVSFPDSLAVTAIARGDRSGSLGSEILRRFDLIFDYGQSRVLVKKNRFIKQPFRYNLAGMELIQPFLSLPYLEVTMIREGSPAEKAGLKVGDVIKSVNDKNIITNEYTGSKSASQRFTDGEHNIIHIDGSHEKREASFISLPEIQQLFFSKRGKKVKIRYTRGADDTEYQAVFILEEVL